MKTGTLERVEITLSDAVVDAYRELAKRKGETLEKILEDRLIACLDYDANRPLYFDDEERNELERLTGGRVISEPREALRRIKNCQSIWITDPEEEPVKVQLSPALLSRLLSRAFRRTREQTLREETVKGLERFCGMR